jgi:hypothetical protein
MWRQQYGVPNERTCLHLSRLQIPLGTPPSGAIASTPPMEDIDVTCPLAPDMNLILERHLPRVLEKATRATKGLPCENYFRSAIALQSKCLATLLMPVSVNDHAPFKDYNSNVHELKPLVETSNAVRRPARASQTSVLYGKLVV